jgi:hypothetical protein
VRDPWHRRHAAQQCDAARIVARGELPLCVAFFSIVGNTITLEAIGGGARLFPSGQGLIRLFPACLDQLPVLDFQDLSRPSGPF